MHAEFVGASGVDKGGGMLYVRTVSGYYRTQQNTTEEQKRNDKTRQDKTRDKMRQGKAKPGKARQGHCALPIIEVFCMSSIHTVVVYMVVYIVVYKQ